jgi:hypothetical protein
MKLSDSFSDSHFLQFFQEKIISRKEFPTKTTRMDVFWVIYRNSQMLQIRIFLPDTPQKCRYGTNIK